MEVYECNERQFSRFEEEKRGQKRRNDGTQPETVQAKNDSEKVRDRKHDSAKISKQKNSINH